MYSIICPKLQSELMVVLLQLEVEVIAWLCQLCAVTVIITSNFMILFLTLQQCNTCIVHFDNADVIQTTTWPLTQCCYDQPTFWSIIQLQITAEALQLQQHISRRICRQRHNTDLLLCGYWQLLSLVMGNITPSLALIPVVLDCSCYIQIRHHYANVSTGEIIITFSIVLCPVASL